MSFTRKRLDLTFKLGTGSFGESGADTVKLSGLRASAAIVKAGGASMGSLQLRVFGMVLSDMNQLSTLGKLPMTIRNNTVTVEAGDDESGMGVVFTGTISDAWVDPQAMPDVGFQVSAYAGLLQAVKPVAPFTHKGSADVATIMSSLAALMGLTFENNGVQVQLASPYLPGTARQQAQACADAANINWIIDNGKLAIWPKNGTRGTLIPEVNPDNGMIGYPSFTATGIVVNTVYNPSLGYGSRVKVTSELTPACGIWQIYNLAHNLEAETPNGKWETRFEGAPPGYVPVS